MVLTVFVKERGHINTLRLHKLCVMVELVTRSELLLTTDYDGRACCSVGFAATLNCVRILKHRAVGRLVFSEVFLSLCIFIQQV